MVNLLACGYSPCSALLASAVPQRVCDGSKGIVRLSIISVWELTFASREIIERTLDVYRVLAVASVFYFIMCFAIDRVGRWMEGRLAAKGFAGEPA